MSPTRFLHLILGVTLALCVAGCSQSDESDETAPETEPEAVEASYELTAAADCDDLRERLVVATTDAVLHSRYGGLEIDDKVGGKGDDSETSEESSEEDFEFEAESEVPVEEDDIVKLVGETLFVATDDAMVVVDRDADGQLVETSRVGLGGDLAAAGIFVRGESAAIFSIIQDDRDDAEFGGTRVTLVDLADTATPEVTAQFDVEGSFEFARLVGEDYFLVTSSTIRAGSDIWEIAYGESDLPAPEPNGDEARQEELRNEARGAVESLVRERFPEDVEALLPRLRMEFDDSTALLDCDALLASEPSPSVRIINVTRFDEAAEPATVSVLGDRFAGHADGASFYLAFSDRWGEFADRTRLHRFTTTEQPLEYVASGIADGTMVDEYSLDAHGDTARLITTTSEGASVHAFEVDGDALVSSDEVAEIGDEGLVVANRFTAENAFVATFGSAERIWSVDLGKADVSGPFEVGGLATMIHTIEEDRVLVVAQQTNEDDEQIGVRLELFEPGGETEPVVSATVPTGPHSNWSEAMWDPRSLAYDPETGLVAFPVNIGEWEENEGANFSGVLVYRADNETVEQVAVIDHTDLRAEAWCVRNDQAEGCEAPNTSPWWTHVRRSVFAGGNLLTISDVGVKSHSVDPLEEVSQLLLVQ